MSLIFFLSHQDKDASKETSEWVLALLNVFNLDIETLRAYNVSFFIRKAAHMTEYFVLFLLTHRLLIWHYPDRKMYGYALLFCGLYAATDEFHQSFVPGRGASIIDVGIDTTGAILALVVYLLWRKIKGNVSLHKTYNS